MTEGYRRIAGIFLLLSGLLLLAGCSQQLSQQFKESWLYRVVPKEKVDLAKRDVAALQDGKIGVVEGDLDPQYFDANIETTLNKIASLFPKEKPRGVSLIGANVTTNTSGQTLYGITLEYEFSQTWIVANVILETKAGSNKVWLAGIHVWPLSQSIEETNAFRLKGKSPLQYIHLALAIFVPLFTLFTAIVAGFSYIPRRKWLWIIFILVGFGQFNLNWTTGQTGFVLLAFELLGAMYGQSGFAGPVIISVGVPLGAMLFWRRRSRWRAERREGSATDMRS